MKKELILLWITLIEKDRVLHRIFNIAKLELGSNLILGLLFLFPILPFNFVSILTIALVLITIFEKIIIKDYAIINDKKHLIFSGIFYVFLISTLLYTKNLKEGLDESLNILPIFLFPLIFCLKRKTPKIKIYILVFILSNLLFTLYIYNYFLTNFFLGCHYEMSLLPNYVKIQYIYDTPFYELLWCSRKIIEPGFFVHKVYNSMYLLFCNFSIIYLLKQYQFNKWFKLILIIVFILFSLMIINMISLVNLFLFLIVLPLLLFTMVKKSTKKYLSIILITFFISGSVYVFNNESSLFFITKEIKWISDKLIKKNIDTENTSIENIDLRYYISLCGTNIIKDNFIFGVGIGDTQDVQNNCYYTKSQNTIIYTTLFKEKLNSHNQYLTYFIAGGIFLFIAFLMMIFYNFKQELLNKNYIYIFFLILIISNFAFESMLDRMFGVMFFCLFNSLLRLQHINLNEKN